MPELYRRIVEPVVTEKSQERYAVASEYTFRVHPRASKPEIRQAVEKLFEVTVTDVRTMLVRGKLRTRGKSVGRRAKWKKAIITLREGDKIDIFEV